MGSWKAVMGAEELGLRSRGVAAVDGVVLVAMVTCQRVESSQWRENAVSKDRRERQRCGKSWKDERASRCSSC